MDNLSLTIKERILLIAGHAQRSKIDFFRDLGLSYANFKGEQKKSGLSSDALLKVLAKYPEINPSWLLLGEGEMLKTISVEEAKHATTPKAGGAAATASFDEELRTILSVQEKQIATLKKHIEIIQSSIQDLSSFTALMESKDVKKDKKKKNKKNK